MIRRTLNCTDCGFTWQEYVASSDVPVPECAACQHAETRRIPGPFAITGAKSKAIDMAQQMAEQDYGLTDIRDNQRAGDIAAVGPPPIQTSEAEAITREMVQAGVSADMAPIMQDAVRNFWQQNGAVSAADTGSAIAAAAPAAAAARASGHDPIGLLHQAGKSGASDIRLNVVGRASAGE